VADYVIGDLQGCYAEFISLLQQVDFNPSKDHLYLVGDVVARGPDSLACVDYLYQQQGSVSITLGNHDLHLLATYLNHKKPNEKDKLTALFNSEKLSEYIKFLQHQPLAIWLNSYNSLICHAGLNPQLSLKKALEYAKEAEQCYQGEQATFYLSNMYGSVVNSLAKVDSALSQFCFTVNSFTRMRFVNQHLAMDFTNKASPKNGNQDVLPWFNVNPENHNNINIIFGHWAALEGRTPYTNLFALDTGCVWGKSMTLIELKNKTRYQQNAFNS
jgi:bis(5'-nucleosyl)-tetraphosphatase (symmetrical)